ncbi:MAG: hypothetical protein ACXW5U_17565 [Thermoanaerobaculia bacterium]
MSDSKFKNSIDGRYWEDIRDAWLGHVPIFSGAGSVPDPGLERLIPLQEIVLPSSKGLVPDVPGVRSNMLSEAVFLFHKCAHAHLAAQRLGSLGMHSWSMFNAYHAAYLGARGVMALLGIGFPYLPQAGQLLLDVYPRPEAKRNVKAWETGKWQFIETRVVRLGGSGLDQTGLWDAFHRTLRVSKPVCDEGTTKDLLNVSHDSISKRRNAFLYRASFWPGSDLLDDSDAEKLAALVEPELDDAAEGFLLRLSCDVYRLFEQLVLDLAKRSGPIREQLDKSRIVREPNSPYLLAYNAFLAQGTGVVALGGVR